MSDLSKEILDVCIIGGGFSGLNCARLIKKGDPTLSCHIFTETLSASRFWVGTVDVLNYGKANKIENDYPIFSKDIENHPYSKIEFKIMNESLKEYFNEFQNIKNFEDADIVQNKSVITTIGNNKPCVGVWNSIFSDYNLLSNTSKVVLVEFMEFNNSAMTLVGKGFEEHKKCKVFVLKLSFMMLLELLGISTGVSSKYNKLSESKIAQVFDDYSEKLALIPIANYIKNELKKQFPLDSQNPIDYILFPPVMGLKNNKSIISNLSELLDSKCNELVAISPSIIAERHLGDYFIKLKDLGVEIKKGNTLTSLSQDKKGFWICEFDDKDSKNIIKCKNVILATGSLFVYGLLNDKSSILNELYSNNNEDSFNLTKDFEVKNKVGKKTGLYVCGNAILFNNKDYSEDLEIKFGTGLGLSIATSYIISKKVLSNK